MFTLMFKRNTQFFINILLLHCAVADYCEFGICEPEEYCCGDNKCCKKKVDLWYYWAIILLIVIAIGVSICLYWKMKIKKRQENYIHIAF